ncbi:pre-rRNA 2'-O-ribose RNA methyltransferase FTSJ3 [Episyrphus balteatus]|uniref:pre-rRNA 2'-O-ribose RNA methyltransferase FTSJ3 n=1 Tax=Episyrphus balteatus TaxID=286459 RepID=UPI002485C6A4|nr:pre-rRNA 2'-O-ribose RNA methyltransferase FTSJ3 [Episyrphus balteatus]
MGKKTKVGKARKDKFYQLAKETGFRSRAAFKLIQLNRKFGFLQQSQVCIDLCAAPGGWMQVAKQNMPVSSIVVGVDLFPIRPIPGCIGLVEDITTEKCRTSLTKELQTWKADVVLHDGAPNVGKNWLFDAYQQICLTLNALKLSTQFLRGGGWFVTKVFRSKDYNALLWVLKQLFRKVHATKPSASRKESAEIFIVCQGYLAPDKIDGRLLDPKYVFEELDLEGKKKSSLLHPDKQKRIKAEGYTEQEVALRNDMSVKDFMESSSGLAALQGIGSITVNDQAVLNHPRTTKEILECCKDIKVLGRKDIKGLLAWWKAVKEDLFKKPEETETAVIEEEAPAKPLTEEEIQELDMEQLDKLVHTLADEEKKDLKRKKKKTQKAKTKLNEKMNLNMVIKGDEGPREAFEDEVFELKQIKNAGELDAMLDVVPDFDVEGPEMEREKLPKYKRYEKDDQRMNDDAQYENDSEPDVAESDSESDLDKEGLGLSGEEDDGEKGGKKSKKNKKKRDEHPLIKSGDFRDKDTKRQQRVQLWFEKENLQKVDSEDDEDYDLDRLATEYKAKGVAVLGADSEPADNGTRVLGKKAKRKAKYAAEKESSSSESSDSEEEITEEKVNGDMSKEPKIKKIRLSEEELALGAMLIKGKKTRRDLVDSAWNRYAFNDENLPAWFATDEDLHMKKPIPVPKEIEEEYQRKVEELNVRPIKKVMEAKARKRRRATRRLEKAKKNAEKIMNNADASAQEKSRQLKKIYKKAEEKKKDLTYVVAKRHLSGKRVRRPAGVKGRFRVVDPRQKKDKRAVKTKAKREKKRK